MAKVHGKDTYVSIDGDDISDYGTNVEYGRGADSHDVTTFGNDSHVFQGGLKTGTITVTGIYDNTAVSGPRNVLEPLIGNVVPYVYRPEGVGAGKPEDNGDVLVTAFNETAPVADMITWVAELTISGTVDTIVQP